MKSFLCCFVILFAIFMCIHSNALDFTGNDGTVYKSASVLKVMPDGLVISYSDTNGFEDIKHINISQLPDDIIKQYNLNAQTAAAFDSQRLSAVNAIDSQKIKNTKEYYAKQKIEIETYTKITDYLRAKEIEIIFNAINQADFGSIGYAYRADDYDKEAPFGLICLLGKSIEPAQDWVGKVYPLDKNITYQTPSSTQPVGRVLSEEVVIVNQSQQGNTGTKEKIPCYADYQTALDYFSNHPQAIGK